MANVNYQKELEKVIKKVSGEEQVPRLFLHSCCAPCSSYVLEYLSEFFAITLFYYNPNIYPETEYRKRVEEQKRLVSAMPLANRVTFLEGAYDPKEFYAAVKGLEGYGEGSQRCFACFALRLEQAARLAAAGDFDYYTTTLTISPLKNAQKLNEIGREMGEKHHAAWLPSDFKKREGYKRSIQLSEEYGLYRQNYCGCIFSQKEAGKIV